MCLTYMCNSGPDLKKLSDVLCHDITETVDDQKGPWDVKRPPKLFCKVTTRKPIFFRSPFGDPPRRLSSAFRVTEHIVVHPDCPLGK